jgi:hypothetical protein
MKIRSALLAVLLAGALGVSAVACSSDDEKSSTDTTAAEATTTTAADDDDDTTTTTASSGGAPCTEAALTLAGAASGPEGNFDKVTEYECDGGYAYAWLVDSSKSDSKIISQIFQDDGGSWSAVTGPLCDGSASGNVPTEILTKGCTYAS